MSTAIATVQPTSPLATRPLAPLPPWVLDISRRMGRVTAGNLVTTYLDPLPTADQRALIESNRANLARQLEQTPNRYPDLNDKMLDAIGELMAAKPYRNGDGALRREALVRSFGYALDEIPAFATLRAVRNWHRGDVEGYGDPKGKFNCKWMPDPTELKQIAKRYVREVENRIELLDDILGAIEPSADAPRGQLPTPKRRDRDDGTGFRPVFDCVVVPAPKQTTINERRATPFE